MRILITGACGFVGRHLTHYLQSVGHEIVATDIQEIDKGILWDMRGEAPNSLYQDTFDCIVHLAAVHQTPGHAPHEYYETNLHSTLNVIKIARKTGIKNIVFVSSISVYGMYEELRDETSPTFPTSDYGRSKLISEQLLLNLSPGNCKIKIIRPGVVFGLGENGNFDRLLKLIKYGVFIYPGRRDVIKSCIYVKDLVYLINKMINVNQKECIINACYNEDTTTEVIVNEVTRTLKTRIIEFSLPYNFMRKFATFISKFDLFSIGIHPERIEKLNISNNIKTINMNKYDIEYPFGFKQAIKDWLTDARS